MNLILRAAPQDLLDEMGSQGVFAEDRWTGLQGSAALRSGVAIMGATHHVFPDVGGIETLRHSFPDVHESAMVLALQRSRNSMIGAAEILRDPFLESIRAMAEQEDAEAEARERERERKRGEEKERSVPSNGSGAASLHDRSTRGDTVSQVAHLSRSRSEMEHSDGSYTSVPLDTNIQTRRGSLSTGQGREHAAATRLTSRDADCLLRLLERRGAMMSPPLGAADRPGTLSNQPALEA